MNILSLEMRYYKLDKQLLKSNSEEKTALLLDEMATINRRIDIILQLNCIISEQEALYLSNL